tara:strand:- start:48 stop:881 length:834 start_codon:yes stop_codon:yes gene_type:complete
MKKIYLIGEIGINHNGSLKIAKKIISEAKKRGFNAVKFQKRNPDISTPEKKKYEIRNTPWGNLTYLDYKKKIEFGKKEFDEIDKYCKKMNIDWFASAWDIDSLKFLKKYKIKFNKVASAMIKNVELLKAISRQKKTTLISTGMSSMKDVEKAVKIFKKNKCKFILMHCVSSYPTKEENLNLRMINTLKKKFGCEVGYSGHEKSVTPSLYAAVLGATIIERHITIDRTMWGTDQSASLELNGMSLISEMLPKINRILGDGKKKILKDEKLKFQSQKYW